MTAEEIRAGVEKAAEGFGLDVLERAVPTPTEDHWFIGSGPEEPFHYVLRAWEVEGTLRVDLYGVIKTLL